MVPWLISLLLRCPYSLLSCTSRWSCYFAQLPVNTTTTRIWSGQAVLPFLHVAVFAVKTASNFWSWFWAQDVWFTLSYPSTKLAPSFFFLGIFLFSWVNVPQLSQSSPFRKHRQWPAWFCYMWHAGGNLHIFFNSVAGQASVTIGRHIRGMSQRFPPSSGSVTHHKMRLWEAVYYLTAG